jgi:hypothetical protein
VLLDLASTQGDADAVRKDAAKDAPDVNQESFPDVSSPPDAASASDVSPPAELAPADLRPVVDSLPLADFPLDCSPGVDAELSVDNAKTDSPASEDGPFGDDAPRAWDLASGDAPAPVVDSPSVDVAEDACASESDVAFCARTGNACGSVIGTDNCGQPRSTSCGDCPPGLYCGAAHQCVCVSENEATFCAHRNKQCGSYVGSDNCGQVRNVNCGTCGTGLQCNGQSQCVCAPETDAAFCARSGKACGAFTGIDNCGRPRSVADCGSCDDANACTNDSCNAGTCRHVSLLACAQQCSPSVDCGLVDTDGDGLNDVWEQNGYVDIDCNGQNDEGIDTPLPDADKNKPNVYVKWDYMRKASSPAHSHMPSAEDMDWARSILASHDILLRYYPTNDEIAEVRVVSVSPPDHLVPACVGGSAISFSTLKAAHFPSFLAPAYHYGIFAHNHTCGIGGDCSACPANEHTIEVPAWDSTGVAIMPGKDFIVSFGYWNDIGAPASGLWITAGFLHQLGHNMGLGNGGGDNLDRKPNYISVMNSSYAFGIPIVFPWNPDTPWSLQYQNPAGGFGLDFSTFTAGELHEGSDLGDGTCGDDGSGGLDETVGVPTPQDFPLHDIAITFSGPDFGIYYGPSGGHPIDWDLSLEATDQHVYRDVSGDGRCSDLPGFNDMELVAAGPGVTKMAHLHPNVVCDTGTWTNGVSTTP